MTLRALQRFAMLGLAVATLAAVVRCAKARWGKNRRAHSVIQE